MLITPSRVQKKLRIGMRSYVALELSRARRGFGNQNLLGLLIMTAARR